MKQKINNYLNTIKQFDQLSFNDQVKVLCYFQADKDNQAFAPSSIIHLFEVADVLQPKNIYNCFSALEREQFLIKTKKGYKLSRSVFSNNKFISNNVTSPIIEELTDEDKRHHRANVLFHSLELHPTIVRVSRKLFIDKHYAQAILEAFKSVNNMVKSKSGKTRLDGKNLMTTVFSKNNPILKMNMLITPTDQDEQEGYMHLFAGAMLGIRNPKAHEEIVQNNPLLTIKLLCLASLLAEKTDKSTKHELTR